MKHTLKTVLLFLLLTGNATALWAQYGFGTNTPAASAAVDITSTRLGFLPPRMTTQQRTDIASPAEGLMVYDTDIKCMMYFTQGAWNSVFTFPSLAPVVSNVEVNGDMLVGSALTASYTYTPSQGVAEGASTYKWYTATSVSGANKAQVATTATYTVVSGNQYIAVEVTPISAYGKSGTPTLSPWRIVQTNAAPVVTEVVAIGCHALGSTLSAKFIATDKENDIQGAVYYWYYATNDAGANATVIPFATAATYKLAAPVVAGNYVRVGVTPAVITGTTLGLETFSPWKKIADGAVPTTGTFTITHTKGTVAPVTKTVTYGTVYTNITGAYKCWITQNLGADRQATDPTDDTDASAGWYWQFGRSQGYNSTTMMPVGWGVTGYDWRSADDPCGLLLDGGWRLPTKAEYEAAGGTLSARSDAWNNYNDTYNSVLKLHAAGFLDVNSKLTNRGINGAYNISDNAFPAVRYFLYMDGSVSSINNNYSQVGGLSVRCLRD